MSKRILFNFILALEGINANKLRAILTALGIVFGVGAVIAMLAIGSGAKLAILEQMKLIGTNNIVVKAVLPSEQEEEEEAATGTSANTNNQDKRPYSPGLTLKDADAFRQLIPSIERVSPEIVLQTNIIQSGKMEKGRCIGVTNAFFELNMMELGLGNFFHDTHLEGGKQVCIIGKNIQNTFFSAENPIGQQIKCGNTWLTIIGVLDKRLATKENIKSLGIRDYNSDVYVPISTALLRFKNRALVTKQDISRRGRRSNRKEENYHQIDRVVIQVANSDELQATADVIARTLRRRHRTIVDYEVQVPELLLAGQQKTQDTFNLVLAAIAGISLLVGGIGIMNIMLASVLERIKEIGVRRSLGANQQDIVLQFLFEAVFISLIGGIIGAILGIAGARTIAAYADIPTIVSAWSVILSFVVAASVGLVFGIVPAQRAAKQDPIKALRTD